MGTTSQVSERSLANLRPWQPGQSGNPGGGPRSRNLLKALRNAVEADYDGVSGAEMIASKLLELVQDGNVHAIREINDRLEGKPLQANINVSIDERVLAMDDEAWEEFKLREDQRRASVVRVQLDPLPTDAPGAPLTIELRSAKAK